MWWVLPALQTSFEVVGCAVVDGEVVVGQVPCTFTVGADVAVTVAVTLGRS